MKSRTRSIMLAILLVCPVVILGGCWLFLTVNVPYWDDYAAFIKYFSEPWPGRWRHLLDLHNEHRIVTTRLIADVLVALNGGVFNFRAMMAVGNSIQLAYAIGWLLAFRKSTYGVWSGIPVFWLLTSFLHYENTCWALTSVQNVIVVALAFVACQSFARRDEGLRHLALALVCAAGATYSSGGGMLVWPCLIAMEGCAPFSYQGHWAVDCRKILNHIGSTWRRVSVLIFAASLSIGFYLKDFAPAGLAHSIGFTERFVNATLFTLAFLGGIVPVYGAALVLGALFLPVFIYLICRYPKIKSPGIFWFTMVEFGTMLTAAFFRSEDPHTAISSRYCIVSCSVFAGLLFLALEQVPMPQRLAKYGISLITAGIILYTTAFLVLGAPLFAARNELMRRNILTWPSYLEGLRSNAPEIDSEYLRKCVECGIYTPDAVLKLDEVRPKKPESWLR